MSRTTAIPEPATGPRHISAKRGIVGAAIAAAAALALLAPAGQAQAAPARPAPHCAHHTTGVCAPWVRHPRGATAQCKDGTFSFSAHFSGTCSHHHGVRYWFK